jgi:hypothetical protein
VTLPTTPTVYVADTVLVAEGFTYNTVTGILTFQNSGSYGLSLQLNAEPSASNKNIYFYAETSIDGGATWVITKYSARQLRLDNAIETQLNIISNRYYATGTMLRFYVWGDATITLKTTDLPGTTPGTVVKPAFRILVA